MIGQGGKKRGPNQLQALLPLLSLVPPGQRHAASDRLDPKAEDQQESVLLCSRPMRYALASSGMLFSVSSV